MKKMVFVLLFLFSLTHAYLLNVESISNYTMDLYVNQSNVHVVSHITLKNNINQPIVPGLGEIRLQKKGFKKILGIPLPIGEEVSPINISNLKIYTNKGNIKYSFDESGGYSIIHYEIWKPINPGDTFTFVVEYDSKDLIDEGLFFKTISIPIGSDITIDHLKINVISDLNPTYKDPPGVWEGAVPAGGLMFYSIELSPLPLPLLPLPGYMLFWIPIIILLIVATIYLVYLRETPTTTKRSKRKK